MQLNLPMLEQLKDSQNILIAGAGGGFDIFAGLPVYFALRDLGKNVYLANYSFTELAYISQRCEVTTLYKDVLVGATAGIGQNYEPAYYPEGLLSRWFKEARQEDVTVWAFGRVGPKMLRALYMKLVEHLNIDAIVLIDGGVDSVMIGDEEGAGTLLEDTISLAAVAALDVPVKILGCIGFGAELEVSHHNALANMAALVKEGAFIGCCALTKQMQAYQLYEQASRYVWEQPDHHKSQINMRIVSATQGEFGNHHLYHDYRPAEVFVSPLMSLYWFFDADAVARRSLLAKALLAASTIEETHQGMIDFYSQVNTDDLRPHKPLPI